MKKTMTRVTLLAASALSFAVVGMSGAASASSINVSTMGPGSGVHINVGGGGCNSGCGNNWGNDNSWDNSGSWGNTWHNNNDDNNMPKCQKHEDGWKMNKKGKCCKKVTWNNWCWTRVSNCWNWCRRTCF